MNRKNTKKTDSKKESKNTDSANCCGKESFSCGCMEKMQEQCCGSGSKCC